MKVTKLTIKNVGMIADMSIDLNKPLILFYGEIRQGKTTILNAVKWCFGGSFPSDIIRHGQKDAFVELAFDGGCIRREWYIAKDGSTKAREISFIRAGKPVKTPVNEIKRFLNPFLLDQDYLRNMGETERKAFFTEFLAVDTADLDTEAFNVERDARDLRSKIKGYGEIDLTPFKAVDVSSIRQKLQEVRDSYQTACDKTDAANKAIRESNEKIDAAQRTRGELDGEIASLEQKLAGVKSRRDQINLFLKANSKSSELPRPPQPDTSDAETSLQNAGEQNAKAEQYQKNKKRAEDKTTDETTLAAKEKRLREIKAEKTAKLTEIAETSKIKDLAFDEAGNFTYQGTQAGMLSTSQIMHLSSAISALYPEGFGLDLIDRAESLGKSIFAFVDKAKAEEKTILATIVGEKPAAIPEEIGVFVVENGGLK